MTNTCISLNKMNSELANNEDIIMATFLHGLESSQTSLRIGEHHNILVLDLVKNATKYLETVLTANNTLQVTNEFIEILKVHVTEEHCGIIKSLEQFHTSPQNSEIQEKLHLICMERVTSIPKYLRKQLAKIILEVHENQGLGMFLHVVYNNTCERATDVKPELLHQKSIRSTSDEFLSYMNVIENIVTFMNDSIHLTKNDLGKIKRVTDRCKQSILQNLCYNIVHSEEHPCDSTPMENFNKNNDTISRIPSSFQSEARSEAIPSVAIESLDASGKNKTMAEKKTVHPESKNCLTASEVNDFSMAEHLKKQVRISEKASIDSEEGALEALREQFVETTDALKPLDKPQLSKENATGSLNTKNSALAVEEIHQSEKENLTRTLAEELTSKIPSCFQSEVRSEAIPTVVTESLDESGKNKIMAEKATVQPDSNNCLTASEINDFSKAEHLKKQVRIREKASMDSEEGTLEAVRKQFVETADVLKLLVKPQPSKEIATGLLIKKDSALTVEETHQSEKEDLNRTLAKELTSKIPSCFQSEVRSEAIPTTVTEFLDARRNTSLEEKALAKHDSITLTAAKAQKLEVCICSSCKRHLPTYNL